MYKNIILKACLGMALAFAFVACHQEGPAGTPPEYGKLKFTKDAPSTILLSSQDKVNTTASCNAGDSITVFMQVAYSGAYIYRTDYTWEIIVDGKSEKTVVPVVAPTKQASPPMLTFKAPDTAGDCEVRFKAKYKYSADTEMGTIYGESNTYAATLRVR